MLLFKVAKESWEGAESRVFNLTGREGRRITAHLFSSLFIKTFLLTEEVHEAMLARGYADF
jgi:energy-coupling factor transporter transmembrane protein EcfT